MGNDEKDAYARRRCRLGQNRADCVRMAELLDSLSLQTGALVVALTSAVVGVLVAWIAPRKVAAGLAIAVPIALAYCLYWSPVWLGGHNSAEYSTWVLFVVGVWSIVGLATSLMLYFIARVVIRSNSRRTLSRSL
jgi:hypothetical protein